MADDDVKKAADDKKAAEARAAVDKASADAKLYPADPKYQAEARAAEIKAAAIAAGSTAPRFAVHFAGNGNQVWFQEDMAHILPQLPRS